MKNRRVKKAKRNPVEGATTYYVPSSSDPKTTYMVVVFDTPDRLSFCQCSDFFGRRLLHLGRPTFTECQHIRKVKARKS